MMRLKHGVNFGTRAGSCWRNLFILFLMPWLRKHRVTRGERIKELLDAAYEYTREEVGGSSPGFNVVDHSKALAGKVVETVGQGFAQAAMLDYAADDKPKVNTPSRSAFLSEFSRQQAE